MIICMIYNRKQVILSPLAGLNYRDQDFPFRVLSAFFSPVENIPTPVTSSLYHR